MEVSKQPGTGARAPAWKGAALLLATCLALAAMAQEGQSDACDAPLEKRVRKALSEARDTRNPTERHRKLKGLLEKQPDCMPCLFLTGESAYQRARAGAGSFNAGIGYLEQLVQQCPDHYPDAYYYLGNMYYANQRYAEAQQALSKFLQMEEGQQASNERDARVEEVQRTMPELAFYEEFYKDGRRLNPVPIEGVNTPADEYLPMFSPDNQHLFFTRLSKRQALGDRFPREVEELTEARRASTRDQFDSGQPLPPPFNLGDSYGGVTVSLNNKELFVTVCKPVSAQYHNCDIYRTHYETHVDFDTGEQRFKWGALENLGPKVNTDDGWESQPSLSSDGRTLYFATLRRGSQGHDIYVSHRGEDGQWSQAEPLPAPINTEGDEKAPFMHSDSQTLYFAARPPRDENGNEDLSRGHRGIGGYDIFYSRRNTDGTWTTPKNLGHPINTPQDEHGLIVSADGRTAYFASGRFKGPGGLDIYGFELPAEARPQDILIVKGAVHDGQGRVVRDASVSITYMDTRKSEVLKVDPIDGRYAAVVRLKEGADVRVTVKKPDHVFDSRTFSVEDTAQGGVAQVDMKLEKIELEKNYRVNDINFATNSAELKRTSRYILDELVEFMQENPKLRIQVQGHTDNVGSHERNIELSNERAGVVVDYLAHHGVQLARMQSKGFGATQPVASNETEEGRARNRRTTFLITAM